METVQIWIPLMLTFFAGLSTGIGSFISLFIKKFDKRCLCFSLGLSAGVMIYVSFVELLGSAIGDIGFFRANAVFFGGILFIMAIDFLVPHIYIAEKSHCDDCNKKIMAVGVLAAIGIAIHNFPEGIAVFMSAAGNIKLGIVLAVAIAIHNIPEGISVAMPIYYATKSRRQAFWYSMLAGIAEPVGAVIAILILMPILSQALLSMSLAFVAGIMVFISFDELLPLSFKEDKAHISFIGVMTGMIVMAASLFLLSLA